MQTSQKHIPVAPKIHALFGFALGLLFMIAAVQIFKVNNFDLDNMRLIDGQIS